MQLDLKKIPFGKRLSRYMLYEETDNHNAGWQKGLYLAIATDSGGSFIGGPMTGPKGFALITPVSGGKDLDYTLEADPSEVVLKTDRGNAGFTIDGTKILRIECNGIGLRINGRLGFGSIAVMTRRGVEITMGGSICLISARKGEMSLDCHWELKALRSTDPVIVIVPDNSSVIDLVIYDIDDAYVIPELTESFDECVTESEADFKKFTSGLISSVAEEKRFYDFCAYGMWTGFQSFKGMELAPLNKMSDMNIHSIEQTIAALPLMDTARGVDIICDALRGMTPGGMVPAWFSERQDLCEAVPPVYAYVISRFIRDDRLKDVSKDRLSGLYNSMSKAVSWWLKNRAGEDGLVYYGYRHECGFPGEKIFGAGTPCASPDLAAYIALGADSLSKIAVMLDKDNEALSWEAVFEKQLDTLLNRLWKGSGFESVNTLTGDSAPAEGMLALIPLVLGNHLPGGIIDVLAERVKLIDFEEIPIIPAALIILGLKAGGKDSEALSAASTLVKSCEKSGASDDRDKTINAGTYFSPAACAAILSLSGLH